MTEGRYLSGREKGGRSAGNPGLAAGVQSQWALWKVWGEKPGLGEGHPVPWRKGQDCCMGYTFNM